MKKYALTLIVAMIIPLCANASQKTIDIDVNSETKDLLYSVNIGQREKSVPVFTKISDSNGNINYLDEGYTDAEGNHSFSYNLGNAAGYFDALTYAGGEPIEEQFFVGSKLTVEAESPTLCINCNPSSVTDGENHLSGGKMLGFYFTSYPQSEKYVSYTLDAPAAGMYKITARSTAFNVRWTTDYKFSINGDETICPSDYAIKLSDYTEYTASSGLLKEYDLGIFYFNKGANTFKVIVDKNDPTETGIYNLNIDCFQFELQSFQFDKISSNDACGAYEEGTDVTLSVGFKSFAPDDKEYSYKVTDFWGNIIDENDVTIAKGSSSAQINLGRYTCGWYRLTLFEGNKDISFITFTVVPPFAERYVGETPFAADFAASQLISKKDTIRKMAKAAKLSGIQWMRDRTSWQGFQTSKTSEPYYRSVNEAADILHQNGIKLTTVLNNLPGWTSFEELSDIYNLQKKLSENTSIDLWEIDNETDGTSSGSPADVYSAYYKAAALGNADSDSPALISMSSQCMKTGASYNRLFMKNDLMSYSDIYNFHVHTSLVNGVQPVINRSMISSHRNVSEDNGNREFWITEAGIYIQTDENGNISDTKRAAQAKYNVISTVQSLAEGTKKHFWFIWPQFIENGKEMGTFDKNLNPNPSYQSQAVMTYVLGKAEIKGRLKAEGIEGYVFDNGSTDTAVLWSEIPAEVTIETDSAVTVTDIMGEEMQLVPENGSVSITSGEYPVYVTFAGDMPQNDYTAIRYNREYEEKAEFTEAQHIILQQSFEGQSLAESGLGYRLNSGEETHMTVTVNNFNDSEKTVELSGSLYGYTVTPENTHITVPAMSSVPVNVTLTPNGETLSKTQLNLIFSCILDGEVSSPSASYVIVVDENAQPDIFVDGYDDPANWNTSNIGTGGSAEVTETESGIHFDVTLTEKNEWFYPQINADTNTLRTSDGIAFTVKADRESIGEGIYNIYCYLSDGRSYSLGGNSGITMAGDWISLNCAWEEFVLRSTPLGNSDTRSIDPSLIQKISFGGNFNTTHVGYTLKYLGYFNKEEGEGLNILSGWAGENILKAQVINNETNLGSYLMIAAVYDESGSLINIYTKNVPEKESGVTYDINIKGDMSGKTVRLFAWDSFLGVQPLGVEVDAR